ncbi:uncharacterized protein LOC116411751 [Xenopus tropicalis]|uniref:Uncharacterized protein LOC116411751 n=1 Tax=Xenopus tropicalis TaxID=8364 RepID=A0A8J1JV45_XENTR|nr:uncharacterized protein LOC116411751 [Xenopus tropicalis]
MNRIYRRKKQFTYILWVICILCIYPATGFPKGKSDVIKNTAMAIEGATQITDVRDLSSNENETSSGFLKYLIAMGVLIPVVLMGGLGWYLFVQQKKANWNFDMEKGKPTCPQATTPTETKKLIKKKDSVEYTNETKNKAKKEEKQTPQPALKPTKSTKGKKKTSSMKESLAKEEIQNEIVDKEQLKGLESTQTPRPTVKKIKSKRQKEIKSPEEEAVPSVDVNKDQNSESKKKSALKETAHSVTMERLPLAKKEEESDIDLFLPFLAQYLKERSPSVSPVHRR